MQYIQIKEAIDEQISNGMLSARQKLPSERQLAQSFATTRITLREALSLLEAEGVIYREDRRGWFISPAPLNYYPDEELHFEHNALNQHRQPSTKIVLLRSMLANKEATQLLSLPPFSNIHQIDKIHFLEDSPVAFSRHYVLAKAFPDLLKQDLTRPLSEIYLKDYEQHCQKIQHRIYTRSFAEKMANSLRATDGAPSTVIERLNLNLKGQAIDCCLEYWRHHAINIEFSSGK